MFRSLVNHKLVLRNKCKLSLCLISGQFRNINKNYDKIVKLFPPQIEYKYKDNRFYGGQRPEDEPYLRRTEEEIVDLTSVKLEKDYPNRHWTQVDVNSEPFNEILVGNEDKKFTKTETICDKNLWFWVQRLFPTNELPDFPSQPTDQQTDQHMSGFLRPNPVKPDLSYFIPRTRSKLFPVYRKYKIEGRDKRTYWRNRWDGLYNSYHKELLDQRTMFNIKWPNNESTLTLTIIKQIKGNIWDFEEDLRGQLEEKYKRRILSAVNEPNGVLSLKGDFVLDSVNALIKMGF